jgi:hypothetical protein
VSRSRIRRSFTYKRVVSAAVLLFVFFLPLHRHFGFSAKVAQECACLQGTRTHVAPVPAIFAWAASVAVQIIIVATNVVRSDEWLGLHHVRAPPTAFSV